MLKIIDATLSLETLKNSGSASLVVCIFLRKKLRQFEKLQNLVSSVSAYFTVIRVDPGTSAV